MAEHEARMRQPEQRVGAQRRVVFVVRVELRMDLLPGRRQELPDRCQHRGEVGKPGEMQMRHSEIREYSEIARAVQQSERLLLDLLPVRIGRGDDRVAVLLLRLALSRTFKRSELGGEFQVGAGHGAVCQGLGPGSVIRQPHAQLPTIKSSPRNSQRREGRYATSRRVRQRVSGPTSQGTVRHCIRSASF